MDTVRVDSFLVGTEYETEVWYSPQVSKALEKLLEQDAKQGGKVLNKLDLYARQGFRNQEGDRGPIRNEGNGVWRIGLWGDLFRILGFYTSDRKNEFIAIEAFDKKGQKLLKQERKRIKEVAKTKRNDTWSRHHE